MTARIWARSIGAVRGRGSHETTSTAGISLRGVEGRAATNSATWIESLRLAGNRSWGCRWKLCLLSQVGSCDMIFSRQHANAIATGRKTRHHTTIRALREGARIPVTVRQLLQGVCDAEIVCYVQITHVEGRGLRELTRTEAKHEGYDGPRGPLNWRKAWIETHDRTWALKQAGTDEGLTDEAVAIRFKFYEGTLVHVLTLELVEEPDQWMARSSGRLTAHQATSNPRDAIDDVPLAPQEFVDGLAKKANEARTAKMSEARKDAALESFATALRRARGKQAGNMVRAAERMARTVEEGNA